jgi:hypothetical protein
LRLASILPPRDQGIGEGFQPILPGVQNHKRDVHYPAKWCSLSQMVINRQTLDDNGFVFGKAKLPPHSTF